MWLPPHNLEAERAVLGAVLLEPAVLPRVIELLTPDDDFYKAGHRKIYAAMLRLFQRGEPADMLTVSEELKRSGELEEAGGAAALAGALEEATLSTQLESYVRILKECATKRLLLNLGREVTKWAGNGKPTSEIVEHIAQEMRLVEQAIPAVEPELRREGLDLTLIWPNGIRMTLTNIRIGSDGVRGEVTVTRHGRRLSWGALPLASTQAREAFRKRLIAVAPAVPWSEYLEDACFRLTTAAREGEPLVTLTGVVTSPTRALVPGLVYEGEATLIYGDGDTGKSLTATTVGVAVHAGVALPFGLVPARAVPTAYLDWETSQDTLESRVAPIAAGLGIAPPGILYKRMT
ncbi:MAG: DnaB-like helicase N-terminal domain-containing protein, partial [Candidatus Rokuibacteriota bacterium]